MVVCFIIKDVDSFFEKELDISMRSYLNGIKNLVECGFIAKKNCGKSEFLFLIDPFKLFNGNRQSYLEALEKKTGEDYTAIIATA